jgi:hypothetical protein
VWLEDSIIEEMNANGATFSGEDQVVRRCTFRDNGQLGFSANRAHRLLFTECRVENNNTKGFDRGWEAGGNKLVLSRDVVLEKSRFVRNRGNGIWFDIGNENCTVRQCLIADNEDSGIFYEISFGLKAHDNVIVGNGFATTPGAWGAQAGVSISSSPGCVLERNIIAGNREGFNFREQSRTTPLIGQKAAVPIWCHNEEIRRNIIALNRDAQVWGWFDVQDGRHWPSSGQQAQGSQKAQATPSLSLSDLRLRLKTICILQLPDRARLSGARAGHGTRTSPTLPSFKQDSGSTPEVPCATRGSSTFSSGTTASGHKPQPRREHVIHKERCPGLCLAPKARDFELPACALCSLLVLTSGEYALCFPAAVRYTADAMKSAGISRRRFLKTTTLATGTLTLVPRSVGFRANPAPMPALWLQTLA